MTTPLRNRRSYAAAKIGSIPDDTSHTIEIVPVGAIVFRAQFRIPSRRIFSRKLGFKVLQNPERKNLSASNAGNAPFSAAMSLDASYDQFLIRFIRSSTNSRPLGALYLSPSSRSMW